MKEPVAFTSPIGPLITRYLAMKRALGRMLSRWHILSAILIASWRRATQQT